MAGTQEGLLSWLADVCRVHSGGPGVGLELKMIDGEITDPDYWRAVALRIDAEEQQASFFLSHNESRGVAREAILRDLLVKQTPEPLRVKSGFVRRIKPAVHCSKQCD